MSVPRITPVPLEKLTAELRGAISRGVQSRMLSSTKSVQVWAHCPELALSWLQLMSGFYQNSLLDERLRELLRLKIASITTCQACQLARKSDQVTEEDVACLSSDSAHFTPAEQAALGFAELLAGDYMSIGDEHFARMAVFFSEAQITEINMFCALMLAGGRMTYVQQAY